MIKHGKHKVLFVCLGNICRSPAAESVMRAYLKAEGLSERFEVDSAAVSGHHRGERADGRMRAHAHRRGYALESISRPVTYEDFFDFDHIVCMDESNRRSLRGMAPTIETAEKISLLTDWHPTPPMDHVPDPYYGGAEGFERVLDLIEGCVPHLVAAILAEQ